MNEERRAEAIEAILAQVVAPLVGLFVTYYVGTHAASLEIELRAGWRRLQGVVGAARTGYGTGHKVAEWFVASEAPKVIAHAEDIARVAAEGGSA